MRQLLPIALASAVVLGACSSPTLASAPAPADPTASWHLGTGPRVHVSGKAFVFGPNSSDYTLVGATVSVAEAPEIATTVGADGTFALDVPSGDEASFVLRQPGFHDNQTATFMLGSTALDQVGFQVPTDGIFDLMAQFVRIDPDPERCQIASTVSRKGTEPYGGAGLGEPGVIVSIEPALPKEAGPVYFNYVNTGVIIPDPALTATTLDGGVIYTNVPPGEYRLSATKTGKQFSSVKVRCRKGLLVNAAPPRGLQEL
jgi:hypothetical protein